MPDIPQRPGVVASALAYLREQQPSLAAGGKINSYSESQRQAAYDGGQVLMQINC